MSGGRSFHPRLLKQRGVSHYLLDIGNGDDDLSAGSPTFFLQITAAVSQFERSRIGGKPSGPYPV
jgi:hypothetical protein